MDIISQLQSDPINTIVSLLYRIPAILIALTLHEIAHGYVAYRCGDPTAKMLGRLSLNPLKHLDPLGTLCMVFMGVGWAKPVPINPRNFKHFKRDEVLVSLAGVTANFLLFFASCWLMIAINQIMWDPAIWKLGSLSTAKEFLTANGANFGTIYLNEDMFATFSRTFAGKTTYYGEYVSDFLRVPWLIYVQRFLYGFSLMNIGLMLFNLLPIPPLDGFRVLDVLVLRRKFRIPERVIQMGIVIVVVLVYFTGIFDSFLSQGMMAVQSGVMNACLWVCGLL